MAKAVIEQKLKNIILKKIFLYSNLLKRKKKRVKYAK
jgi:hypothetical protein